MFERMAARKPDSMAGHSGRESALAGSGRCEEVITALERAARFGANYTLIQQSSGG